MATMPPGPPPDMPPAEWLLVLRALADSNRLRILSRLMQSDSCNCELNEALGLTPNLLSHHLKVLRQSGLISDRRDQLDGRWIYYSVDREALSQCREWLAAFLDPTRIQPRPCLCGPEGQSGLNQCLPNP